MQVETLPFLTGYDPPGSAEGTLDPLGLYQIADQLAIRLVPAVRERMQRIRFLTAMVVGAIVTEGMEANPQHPDVSPFMVWEWLVVEAIVRELSDDPAVRGVPGTLVTRRALDQYGYLDSRSYLKTPRIFGFHGVYKQLATHLGLLDVYLGSGIDGEELIEAWSRDRQLAGFVPGRSLFDKWRGAVQRSLSDSPVRTRPNWAKDDWHELADAMAPHRARTREKRFLRKLLQSSDERALGALPQIWAQQDAFTDEEYAEEQLHRKLANAVPQYGLLLETIIRYEAFCRSLQDAFDTLRAEAAAMDAHGYAVADLASDDDFVACVRVLFGQFERARSRLADMDLRLQNLFDERFAAFAEPMSPGELAIELCRHHEQVQRAKSAEGKRAWFDRLGPDRIYMRHQYREARRDRLPGRYIHDYRGWPIRRFYFDLQ